MASICNLLLVYKFRFVFNGKLLWNFNSIMFGFFACRWLMLGRTGEGIEYQGNTTNTILIILG